MSALCLVFVEIGQKINLDYDVMNELIYNLNVFKQVYYIVIVAKAS